MSNAIEPGSNGPIEYVLRLGRAFHVSGYPAHRVEEVMVQASGRLGLEGQFFSTPTSLLAGFGPIGRQQTHFLRVEVGSVDLARIAALHRVAIDVEPWDFSPTMRIAFVKGPDNLRVELVQTA